MAMTASTLVQEHLSMATSEEDAEFEEDDEMGYVHDQNADAFAANNQLQNGLDTQVDTEVTGGEEDALSEDELTDEDADGEDDDEASGQDHNIDIHGDMEDEDDDDEEEGVGAVKIQPREMVDDDESVASIPDDEDSASSVALESEKDSDADSEIEVEWAQAEDDEEVGDTGRNSCVFCHMDEEHDPSEEFEESLACAVCGDYAHRQCARNSHAFKSEDDPHKWRCPGCIENELQPDAPSVQPVPSPPARRTSAPKIARDLLPSQRGVVPNSHSVFDTLIIGDSSDGGRLLRHKRKTPSLDGEESNRPQRKRRKDNSSKETEKSIGGGSVRSSVSRAKKSPINEDVEFEEPSSARGTRSRGKNIYTGISSATILKTKEGGLLLKVHTIPDLLRNMKISDPQQKKKRPSRPNARSRAASSIPPPNYHPPPTAYSQPFYSFHDKENDELKAKPYGGILTEAEADTTGRVPTPKDRRAFDLAKQKAEDEWKEKTDAAAAIAAAEQPLKKAKKISGPASQIECIDFGGWEIDTWYAAPYPEEYSRNRVLFICEFCLKYMNSDYVAWRHKLKCPCKHPPGDEIYREGSIMIFEVDGRKNPVYCQNLCLLAKLFLGSKTLYYDVEPFLFYVMTEYDQMGCHFVGYFSKEKRPSSQNNVSCILTLPIHQRKGYGNLLIDFSYLLTRVEKKSGSPEKPLSDMGLVSYRNYWRLVLCYLFRDEKQKLFSIMDISRKTGMTADDIVSALEGLRALVRDPITGTYALRLDFKYFDEYIAKWEAKGYVKLNPKALVWAPYVMGRNNALTYELPPPISTVAPRGDEDEEEIVVVAATAQVVEGMGKIHINGDPQPTTNGTNINDIDKPEGSQSEPIAAVDADGDTNLIESPKSPRSSRSVKSEKNKGKEKAANTTTISQPQITGILASPSSKPTLGPLDTKVNGIPSIPSTSTPTAPNKSFIPPTRFEIFPPIPGIRPRPSTSARPASRRSVPTSTSTPTTISRPPPKTRVVTGGQGGASTRRTPRNGAVLTGLSGATSTRRSSGGTGRGPGRWPKGTKKADFGNADSGPGLPPMIPRSHLGKEVDFGDEDEEALEDDEDDDEIAQLDDGDEEEEDDFESPAPSMNRRGKTIGVGRGKGKGKGKTIPSLQGLGKPVDSNGAINLGMGKPIDKVEAVIGRGKGKGKAIGFHPEDVDADEEELPTEQSNSNFNDSNNSNDISLEDVDAEGDPDPDIDVDAEDEPDLDADIDAEGEPDLDVDVNMLDVDVGVEVAGSRMRAG